MSRNIAFASGCLYHIYNRGTEKRKTFVSRHDYERFLALLHLANTSEPLHLSKEFGKFDIQTALMSKIEDRYVSIAAYCLMPNHYHLLLAPRIESGVSKFIQKLSTAYTMYFNTRYERTGALFQGKFKAKTVDDDIYLRYLISYIHLNPVKLIEPEWKTAGIRDRHKTEEFVSSYEYSSYRDFAGSKRVLGAILDRSVLPDYFETPANFESTVKDWLSSAI